MSYMGLAEEINQYLKLLRKSGIQIYGAGAISFLTFSTVSLVYERIYGSSKLAHYNSMLNF